MTFDAHTRAHGPATPMPRSALIAALEERLASDPEALDAFLAAHEFPLAEPPLYTFVYRGPAEGVRLRHWVHGLQTSAPFRRIAGTDLWCYTVELPDESRVEYKIEVLRHGRAEWVQDPLNPLHARDPFGANSVVQARGYEIPDWTREDAEAPAGVLDELVVESEVLRSARHASVYRPPEFRAARSYPLLIVHDGADYVEYASLRQVLDQLIRRFEIPEIVVALLHPGDRMAEYAADPGHARFVVEELLPRLERDYPLLPGAESRGLMGASLGAVASFHAALRYPGRFGRLLLQSGSFVFTDIGDNERGPVFDRTVAMMNAYRAEPAPLAEKAFVSVGVYEALVSENRALIPVLRRGGVDVRFVETRDGHNWENWRDRLREGLSWLFPGPLWMVYE
ncbi:alpha/beta hydrolase [Candidatus Palauibacter sp.]|uniref:alpha/beta hydrolase n=1 Tax=Candidatus Palauibacter sp. TaxID=3101350 RepID=UPI003AF2FC14